MAFLYVKWHADRLEANPSVKPFAEARPLAQTFQRIQRTAVKEAEVARAFWQIDLTECAEQSVEMAGQPFARS